MRHVHAHGDGRFDALAVTRLLEPFVGAFHEGLRIPLGTQTHDLGAEFFIYFYAALVVTLYRDLFSVLRHEATREARCLNPFIFRSMDGNGRSWARLQRVA
ncbi:hypothetical protein SAMN05216534_0399 [Candidatus Aquiluna sp. UB-MaderosW2red]|nr:hypothetical protein SAMN05216534_0399 [Candidatus Aquiluna sp. UB-MaderosW2red]